MRTRKRSKRLKVLAVVLVGLAAMVVVAAGVAWLAFQNVPAWYKTVEVSEAELSRVRNSLPNTYQALNDRVVAGGPFTFTLTGREVTEWIVARGELYPDARDWLPDWVRDPVVAFHEGKGIIAARIDYDGWQTILALHVVADITDESVTIRVVEITAGALPVPMSQVAKPLGDLLRSKGLDVDLMPDPVADVVRKLRDEDAETLLSRGVSWPNLFEFRNGNRSFKLTGATAEEDTLQVQIKPL